MGRSQSLSGEKMAYFRTTAEFQTGPDTPAPSTEALKAHVAPPGPRLGRETRIDGGQAVVLPIGGSASCVWEAKPRLLSRAVVLIEGQLVRIKRTFGLCWGPHQTFSKRPTRPKGRRARGESAQKATSCAERGNLLHRLNPFKRPL